MSRLAVVLLVVHVGCFDPTLADLRCDESTLCPTGLFCVAGSCLLEPSQGCGDGLISDGELCDDGNVADGDGCSADCSAANCLAPITHPTISDAVADAACTAVYMQAGIYSENLLLTRDVSLEGVGQGSIVIDGGRSGTVISVATDTVSIINVTITGGASENGGGVRVTGDVTLTDVTVTDNEAAGPAARGAGIYVASGSLRLERTAVTNNVAASSLPTTNAYGGGLFNAGGSVVITMDSEFSDNRVEANTDGGDARGGAIFSDGGSVIATDTTFVQNSAAATATAGTEVRGGAIAGLNGAEFVVQDSSFLLNSAAGTNAGNTAQRVLARGGAISASNCSIEVRESNFSDNFVSGEDARGGAVDAQSTALSVSASTFLNNDSRGAGSFEGTINSSGGAINVDLTTALSLTDSTFTGNTVTSSNLDGNSTVSGGALRLAGSASTAAMDAQITGCSFAQNSTAAAGPSAGGSMSISAGSNAPLAVNIAATSFTDNTASSTASSAVGGALVVSDFQQGTRVRLTNSTLSANSASGEASAEGGAIHFTDLAVEGGSGVGLYNVTTTDNEALSPGDSEGGGLYIGGSTDANAFVVLRNSIVFGNRTTSGSSDCVTQGLPDRHNVQSNDYNILGDATNCSVVGIVSPADPLLLPLGSNGGASPTHNLPTGSTAIDAGDPSGCTDPDDNVLLVDQRNLPRPDVGCDLGALEVQ